ncbi:110aa long hypothetical protein [Pyrococcus horikoshii OT3]|uniref:Uncharacterized protein n=1 Tax=Pyrococcus horikoshii (strain ATCC 700860 / DSM 12428 / JCM 9974 / NBRC 100139 / OT-3) TaxID=70601 RepID=O58026_PYRHO|nr:110aa long hypothetical protein [Pyrococcus horikoshii OT3]
MNKPNLENMNPNFPSSPPIDIISPFFPNILVLNSSSSIANAGVTMTAFTAASPNPITKLMLNLFREGNIESESARKPAIVVNAAPSNAFPVSEIASSAASSGDLPLFLSS